VEFCWFERLSACASGGAKGPPVMSSRKSGTLLVLKSKFCSSSPAMLTVIPHSARSHSRESESWIHAEDSPLVKSSLPEQHFFDVFNVPPHCQLCGIGVMTVNRSQNSPVAGQRFLRPSVDLQTAFP